MSGKYLDYKLKGIILIVLIITFTSIWWSPERTINQLIRRYDLRIIVIVYNRAHSLTRLLNSLNEAEYGNDSIKLEVWIDRSKEGKIDGQTLQAAQTFTFKHGEYEISPHQQHVGIYGQWFTTWKPDVNSSEIAVILEDDLAVSKYFWKYLKIVHQKYDKNADINGYSLQGYIIKFSKKRPRTILKIKNSSFVFLFPVVGSWGFSPSTKNWNKFLLWLETQDIAKDMPNIPDNIATAWYKTLTKQGKAHTMWEIWHIYYAWKNKEYTLFCNFPDPVLGNILHIKYLLRRVGLTTNWREKGLHSTKTEGSSNPVLTEWKTEYENLPDNITYIDIAGNVIRP